MLTSIGAIPSLMSASAPVRLRSSITTVGDATMSDWAGAGGAASASSIGTAAAATELRTLASALEVHHVIVMLPL